jgi:hypothetical protein
MTAIDKRPIRTGALRCRIVLDKFAKGVLSSDSVQREKSPKNGHTCAGKPEESCVSLDHRLQPIVKCAEDPPILLDGSAKAGNHRMYDFQLREEGPRTVATLAHPVYCIEVVTGYEAGSDRWPVHVYINGNHLQLPMARLRTKHEAIDHGLTLAIDHLSL